MKSIKAIFFCFMLLSGITATAQSQQYFHFGPKAAFSVNSFQELRNQENIQYENFKTVSAGAFGRLNLGKLYVQPELYFLVKGANFSMTDSIRSSGKIRLNTFETPVLLGYHLLSTPAMNLRAFAGPVFNLYTKETQNDLKAWDRERYDFEEKVNSLQIGLGVDVLMLTVDARYEYGLSKINPDLNVRPQQFIISVGYKMF